MKHFINHDIYHARNQMIEVLNLVMNQIIDHGINHAKQHPKIRNHAIGGRQREDGVAKLRSIRTAFKVAMVAPCCRKIQGKLRK